MSEEHASDPEGGSPAGREPKVIKRYTNRKLYDTEESRYVTLDEIAEMVKAGAEVRILDNRTKEDLTSVTLAQIIFEEEKKTSKMSLKMLREIIRHGGERVQQFVEETQAEIKGRVEAVRGVAEQKVASLLKTGQQTGDKAKELVSTSQEALTTLQKRVDERIRTALDGVGSLGSLQKELSQLTGKLEALEKKLKDLE
jgi:polyhydroxyalkanoate synthesis repressor PhaR